jgi:hypothetical protein
MQTPPYICINQPIIFNYSICQVYRRKIEKVSSGTYATFSLRSIVCINYAATQTIVEINNKSIMNPENLAKACAS